MATIYKRERADGSFVYWTKFRRDGQLIRTNTGTDIKVKAEKFLRTQLNNIDDGAAPEVDVRRVTYAELRENLVEHYQTTGRREEKEYMKRLNHLDEFFARHRAAAITEPELTKYVAYRQAQLVHRAGGPATPPSGATINRELLVLGKMLKLGHRARLLVHVPHIEKLEEAPPRSGFVSVDQFETIRKNLAPDLQLAVVLGFTYGLRVSEVLGLEWERHIDFDSREIWLFAGETKNDDARSLPFTDEVEVLLNEQRARIAAHGNAIKDKACVFPILPGERVPAKLVGTRRRGFARAWAAATRAAGLPGLLVHDLRRSAVRNLVRAGVSPTVAQTISGHRSANVFSRYNITSADDRRDAMAKVRAFQISGGSR